MRHLISAVLLAGVAILGTGCAICCAPDDDTYAAYGGKWPRYDRAYGRVGSAFGAQPQIIEGDSPEVIERGSVIENGMVIEGGTYIEHGSVMEHGSVIARPRAGRLQR